MRAVDPANPESRHPAADRVHGGRLRNNLVAVGTVDDTCRAPGFVQGSVRQPFSTSELHVADLRVPHRKMVATEVTLCAFLDPLEVGLGVQLLPNQREGDIWLPDVFLLRTSEHRKERQQPAEHDVRYPARSVAKQRSRPGRQLLERVERRWRVVQDDVELCGLLVAQ